MFRDWIKVSEKLPSPLKMNEIQKNVFTCIQIKTMKTQREFTPSRDTFHFLITRLTKLFQLQSTFFLRKAPFNFVRILVPSIYLARINEENEEKVPYSRPTILFEY